MQQAEVKLLLHYTPPHKHTHTLLVIINSSGASAGDDLLLLLFVWVAGEVTVNVAPSTPLIPTSTPAGVPAATLQCQQRTGHQPGGSGRTPLPVLRPARGTGGPERQGLRRRRDPRGGGGAQR